MQIDDYATELEQAGGDEDTARLTKAEIAAMCVLEHGHGGLTDACRKARRKYKTTWEHAQVVLYYERLLPGRKLEKCGSVARELAEEFSELNWTDLRTAMWMDRENPWAALKALRDIVTPEKPPEVVEAHVLAELRKQGKNPKRFTIEQDGVRATVSGYRPDLPSPLVLDNGRGLRVTIERHEVNGNRNGTSHTEPDGRGILAGISGGLPHVDEGSLPDDAGLLRAAR